jgi:23S rRNA pseudouridine1911/1915/1917 synthase
MWTAGRGAREPLRDAVTEYTVLKRFKKGEHEFSFLEIYPRTGRTHQIRVHLRYLNYPIVSDQLYARKKEKALGFKRQALHSRSIAFRLPDGKEKVIIAPYLKDFKDAISKYIEKN